MSQRFSYIATPLLIVSVCVLRSVLSASQALFCLNNNWLASIDHLEEDDIECIWNLTKDSYPMFFETILPTWKVNGGRDVTSMFVLFQQLSERMSPQMVKTLNSLEPSEGTLKTTFSAIGAAASERPWVCDS